MWQYEESKPVKLHKGNNLTPKKKKRKNNKSNKK